MKPGFREVSHVLVGTEQAGIWLAKLKFFRKGGSSSVKGNWEVALEIEETDGTLLGWHHTHPDGFTDMSEIDRETMKAWEFACGKPLLSAITTSAGTRTWIVTRGQFYPVTSQLFRNPGNHLWLVAAGLPDSRRNQEENLRSIVGFGGVACLIMS